MTKINIKKYYYTIIFFMCNFIFLSIRTFNADIYADDAAFYSLGTLNLFHVIEGAKNYVPGRNLHMVWQNLSFLIFMHDTNYGLYHIFQSFIFTLNSFLLFLVLHKLKINHTIKYLVILLFLYQPISIEVLYWSSALPMHLFSSLFILLLVLSCINSYLNPDKKYLFIFNIFFLVLALYTYDQAATASLAILCIYAFFYIMRNRRSNLFFIFGMLFIGLLISVHYSYLVLQMRPTSSGPVVTSGLIDRILGYAGSIALHPLYLISIITFLISIVIFTSHMKNQRNIDQTNTTFFYFSTILSSGVLIVISFLPAWAWSVSPRHHYLPIIFLIIFLALTLQFIIDHSKHKNTIKLFFYSALISAIAMSMVMANEFNIFWNTRNDLRSETYHSIRALIEGAGLPPNTCFSVVDFASSDASPFYSEVMNVAMGIYTNNSSIIYTSCPGGPSEKDVESECVIVDSNRRMASEVFIDFERDPNGDINWLTPKLISKCL